MELFDRFSEPAKVAIFYALYIARDDGANCLMPEHVLHALVHKDPRLFTVVAPEVPNLLEKLKEEFCNETRGPFNQDKLKALPLSSTAKDIVLTADEKRIQLGQPQVELQHLLLAILACKGPFTAWFTGRTSHSKAQELLLRHGLTASSVEARIREAGVGAVPKS